MVNFFINNDNRIDMLQLKEGGMIKSDDKFLKKYDTNGNSVWDTDEIKKFMVDLEEADSNGDGKIDKNESISWYSKITNITIDKVKQTFTDNNANQIYQSLGNIMQQNLEEQSISRISQNAQEGLDIYHLAIGGAVSKGWNNIKELFNTEYAGDKIYRQLAQKQVSSWLLEKAHSSEGLTAKEYVEEKISLLKALLGANKLSQNEQKQIEDSIGQMDLEELEIYILKLSKAENKEYNNIQKETITDLITKNSLSKNKDLGFKAIKSNSINMFLSSGKANKKLPFDKIFELEMGVPFNQNNSIQKYEKKYLETNAIISVHNKVAEINENLPRNITAMENYNRHGNTTGSETEKEMLYKNLSNSILSALQKFYGNDTTKINEVLAKYNAKLENNQIIFEAQGINDYAVVSMAKEIHETLNANLTKLMDGKTLEDYQNSLKSAYQLAYGSKNSVDLASKFQESQENGVGCIQLGASMAGVALAVLSDGTLLPITGMLIGTFASGVIQGVEAATKEGGMTKDEAIEIAKELVTSGVLTLVGVQEGEIAAKIGHTLMKSCPKFLRYIGEYGSMAVMGALTDYAVTGEISLTQESISNLINIATGVIAHKKMNKMQEHTKIKEPKTEIEPPAHDDSSIMDKLMNKIKNSDDITKTKDDVFNSAEFNGLSIENQLLLIKDVDDFVMIKNITGTNVSDTDALCNVKTTRNCSNEEINNLSNILKKYPQYKNEILNIVNSNYNIKFGETLDGNIASHIDDIITIIERNSNYKEQIIDYVKVQRRANNDTSDPVAGINNYIETLNKYPEHRDFIVELSKNGNLDAKSADGGINTIESALNLYLKEGYKKEDILKFSKQNYTLPSIRKGLQTIKKYPELMNNILNESPVYTLIDNNADTPNDIINKRLNIKKDLESKYPTEMKKLQQTLGDDFFSKVKWEEIIPNDAASNDIKSILNTINESSKFFSRISVNEQKYGKNIQWASKMNDISNGAEFLISKGEYFDRVLNYIAHEYHAYDESTTLETNRAFQNDRRLASGKYRGYDNPNADGKTQFTKEGSYAEYFDRFVATSGKRETPYEDICLTQILYAPNINADYGTMYHPANKYVEPGLEHIRERYNELKPLFNKVQNGEKLTQQEMNNANDKISEMYFLMANIMPYERGSNGISDILMRSIYKGLDIEQPAIKHGISLDLEAFCMDLNEYKKKWTDFFENN